MDQLSIRSIKPPGGGGGGGGGGPPGPPGGGGGGPPGPGGGGGGGGGGPPGPPGPPVLLPLPVGSQLPNGIHPAGWDASGSVGQIGTPTHEHYVELLYKLKSH